MDPFLVVQLHFTIYHPFLVVQLHFTIYQYEIMSGYGDGQFGPNDTMTREQFVTVLGSLSGADISYYEGEDINGIFSDVPNDSWYAPYVTWAYGNGVTSGMGDGTFGVGKPVTREEMAQFLMNYCDMRGGDFTYYVVYQFRDWASISDWAYDAVNNLHCAKVFNGDENNNFNPQSAATRAEAATVFCSFMERHEHNWVEETTVVHHDEVGHYETIYNEACDAPVYEYKQVCNYPDCGAYFDTVNEVCDHIDYEHDGYGSYSSKEVITGYIHYDAESVDLWHIDEDAYDETVVTGYQCAVCGAEKGLDSEAES